jgi:hypothetical protein
LLAVSASSLSTIAFFFFWRRICQICHREWNFPTWPGHIPTVHTTKNRC